MNMTLNYNNCHILSIVSDIALCFASIISIFAKTLEIFFILVYT